jgi:hypothetical protein
MISKIKEFINEVVDVVDWMLAGCPQPVKIPVRIKDDQQRKEKDRKRIDD